MIVKSYIGTAQGLRQIQVEIVLSPGLSQIQIFGLADKVIQESSKRILTALQKQGFRLPPGQTVMVNLSPNHLRKSSQGLDLAIALGILMETEQITKDVFDSAKTSVYGKLSLSGEVLVPEDSHMLNFESPAPELLTGPSTGLFHFDVLELSTLSEVTNIARVEHQHKGYHPERPARNSDWMFTKKMARLMAIVATGEHSLLLAGDAGAGKTTLMESVVPLLRQPDEKSFRKLAKYWKLAGKELSWRPSIQPHHTSSPQAMIGGGNPPRPGEISLAHGGALLLDELLEFHPNVQSALREPMEKGYINVARCGHRDVFPADALVLASTNLCRCGKFHPQKHKHCRCSSLQLRRYLEKLSGPFLDRFTIFHLMTHGKEAADQNLEMILKRVQKAQSFAEAEGRGGINNKLSESRLLQDLASSVDPQWVPFTSSRRRKWSLLRVARTLADLEQSSSIEQRHLEEASVWTGRDYHRLQDYRFNDFIFV